MKHINHFLKCMLGDCPDVSSKRVVGFVAFIVMIIMAILNVTKLVTPAQFIFDGFFWLVLGCFGLNALVDAVKAGASGSPKTTVNADIQVKQEIKDNKTE